MTRPRLPLPPPALLTYYYRQAERPLWAALPWQAQAERAASLQASLCKVLETIERLDKCDTLK